MLLCSVLVQALALFLLTCDYDLRLRLRPRQTLDPREPATRATCDLRPAAARFHSGLLVLCFASFFRLRFNSVPLFVPALSIQHNTVHFHRKLSLFLSLVNRSIAPATATATTSTTATCRYRFYCHLPPLPLLTATVVRACPSPARPAPAELAQSSTQLCPAKKETSLNPGGTRPPPAHDQTRVT